MSEKRQKLQKLLRYISILERSSEVRLYNTATQRTACIVLDRHGAPEHNSEEATIKVRWRRRGESIDRESFWSIGKVWVMSRPSY